MHNNKIGSDARMMREVRDARELFDPSICAMDCRSVAGKAPWGVAYFGGVHFHGVDIYKDNGIGLREFVRTRRHILSDPVGDFVVSIPTRAQIQLRHAGVKMRYEPGCFNMLSTSKPFSGYVSGPSSREQFSQILVKAPGSVMRKLVPGVDDLCNLPFGIRMGAGSVVRSLCDIALLEGHAFSMAQSKSFGNSIVDAIANALLDAPERGEYLKQVRQSSHARILELATDFIFRNLSNPLLDNALVAEHCQVSERYIRAAFESAGIKPCAYIREARLQECRIELQNPELRHRSIIDIAMGWGFFDSAAFSRCYKARFGMTPREERNACRA